MISCSLRLAARVAVTSVAAVTATAWMPISGIKIWLRIDDERIRVSSKRCYFGTPSDARGADYHKRPMELGKATRLDVLCNSTAFRSE